MKGLILELKEDGSVSIKREGNISLVNILGLIQMAEASFRMRYLKSVKDTLKIKKSKKARKKRND